MKRESSDESLPSMLGSLSDLDSDTPLPIRRRGLLPPLKSGEPPTF
jgi:hypothetical protein